VGVAVLVAVLVAVAVAVAVWVAVGVGVHACGWGFFLSSFPLPRSSRSGISRQFVEGTDESGFSSARRPTIAAAVARLEVVPAGERASIASSRSPAAVVLQTSSGRSPSSRIRTRQRAREAIVPPGPSEPNRPDSSVLGGIVGRGRCLSLDNQLRCG
jgi:hypothetical protein